MACYADASTFAAEAAARLADGGAYLPAFVAVNGYVTCEFVADAGVGTCGAAPPTDGYPYQRFWCVGGGATRSNPPPTTTTVYTPPSVPCAALSPRLSFPPPRQPLHVAAAPGPAVAPAGAAGAARPAARPAPPAVAAALPGRLRRAAAGGQRRV